MGRLKKCLIIIAIIFGLLFTISTKVNGASMGMSITKSTVYVGDTFSVTISGINGKVNIIGTPNISLSVSGVQWIEGSLTIICTANNVGTGTVTVKPIDVSTTGKDPQEVTSEAKKSITIVKKEEPKPSQPQSNSTTTAKPTSTTNKKTNTSKPTRNRHKEAK